MYLAEALVRVRFCGPNPAMVSNGRVTTDWVWTQVIWKDMGS